MLVGLFVARGAAAQSFYDVTYRPPGTTYRVVRSPHFDVIFETGLEAQAREAAAILEDNYQATFPFVGLRRPFRMPVVLNGFSDRSNGFVSPTAFRQEIEGVAVKGKVLDPGFASWMETVLPHELTHAMQAQVRPWFGVGGLLSILSPDLNRYLNFTIPPGLTEGVAVYRESLLRPGAGRLNHSFFTMQYRAAMGSGRPWRLAQMAEVPVYSQPFDRFYVGGSHLFAYLAETHGPAFFGRSMRIYNRWPFFGYGVALWAATGQWPASIGAKLRRAARREEEARLDALGPFTGATVVAAKRGLNHRRPRWLDNETLVAYVQGYDVRPGFYRIEAATGRRSVLAYEGITEDYAFSLDAGRDTLYFARYKPGVLASIKAIADVYALDVATGRSERVTRQARVLAPVEAPGGGLWAIQNQAQFTRWVRVERDGSVEAITHELRTLFQELAPSPDGQVVAALINVGGHQGVFRVTKPAQGKPVRYEPLVMSRAGAVYDLSWSPDNRYLLFTADLDSVPNIYAYDTVQDQVRKLTQVPYGAFEASASPDGRTLAYVDYRHERRDLVTIPFRPEEAEQVPRRSFAYGAGLPWKTLMNTRPVVDEAETVRPYRALPRLVRPRLALPIVEREERTDDPDEVDLGYAVGLSLESADPLERWAYGVEGFYQAERFWGEASLQTARFLLRPSLRLYNTPGSQQVLFVDQNNQPVDTVRVGRQERGVEIGTRLPLTVDANVFQTSAAFALFGEYREVRFFDRANDPLNDFSRRITLSPSMAFGYRLQTNPRDLIPNTGVILRSAMELDVWTREADPSRAWISTLNVYLPFLRRANHGLRLHGGVLVQNQGSIYDLDTFVPRGFEDDLFLGEGTFLKAGLEYDVPVWYVDNGLFVIPVYVENLYLYGFAETLTPASFDETFTSVGAGIGLNMRVFSLFGVQLKVGFARQLEAGEWRAVYR